MEKRELICISCPIGCIMNVETESGNIIKIAGNTCKRGEVYAQKEITNPTRVVTSIVRLKNSNKPCVSVKTKEDIPKDKIFDVMKEISTIQVSVPIKVGDVVKSNIAGTGIDLVATKNILN